MVTLSSLVVTKSRETLILWALSTADNYQIRWILPFQALSQIEYNPITQIYNKPLKIIKKAMSFYK